MEELIQYTKQGREASLVLQLSASLIEEQFDALVNNALAAYRGGGFTAERALVFVGKLDALVGFREELEARVQIGEASAEALAQARSESVVG